MSRPSGAAERPAPRRPALPRRTVKPRRRASAAKLRETVRLLTMAERLADFGHWWLDARLRNLELSSHAMSLLGLDPGSRVSPAAVVRLLRAADRRALLDAMRTARRGQVDVACELRVDTSAGVRDLIVQIQSDRGPNGAAGDLFGVIQDITAKIAAERKLVAARDDAEAATVAKSEFLATMSHEIRTPMTGVMGMIDLLQSGPTPEESDRYLAAMRQSAELLMAVLDGILDFSKVESGKLDLVARSFDLEALAERTVDMFQNAASKKGLLFDLRIAAGRSPFVVGDPVRIQQVVSNLISNAVKFTEHGRVSLTMRASPCDEHRQNWRIEVRDTGVGIPEEAVAQLFEPFVQVGNRRCGGTGLGLAISRRLIEAMGGTTGVMSTPGRGSTFWFEIALPIAEAAEAAIEEIVPAIGASEPLRVLVAEDNAINQMLIAAMLRRLGHEVTCVENGRLAVEAANARPFDCILMDMQMPELDGIAATRVIRSGSGPNVSVPVIALTADAAPDRRRFYDNVGLTAFMTKPLNAEALRRQLAGINPARSLERRPSAPEPAISAERAAELRMVLGQLKFLALVRLLAAELIEAPAEMRRLTLESDYSAVRARAHSLLGAAANFGAGSVAAAARATEIALPGAELELALGRLEEESRRARTALLELITIDGNSMLRSA